MSVKVLCIYVNPRPDIPIPFNVGDKLHASEVPDDLREDVRYFGADPDKVCVIDEYPFAFNGAPCTYSKNWFIPLDDSEEIIQEQLQSIYN